jgi:FkbH-like protein
LPALKRSFYQTPLVERQNFYARHLNTIKNTIESLSFSPQNIFISIHELASDEVYGQQGFQNENSFLFQLLKIQHELSQYVQLKNQVGLLSIASSYFNAPFFYATQSDISLEAMPQVAYQLLQMLNARLGKMKKCVIVDLDNTLWGGIVGDDGWENLELGNLKRGKVFEDIQLWLRELKDRGVVLVVCSKNEESTAKEVFEKHPDMVLDLEDFAFFVANWKAKSENVHHILASLNISEEHVLFLDDNPAERALVKEIFPRLTVPDLPKDPSDWIVFLQKQNLFEAANLSEEDRFRTKKYQQNARRNMSVQDIASIESYLKSLEMKAKILPIDSFTLPRVAQLLQRTNQFNLRTVRHSETEITKMLKEDCIGFAFSLQDKFGEEGIVSTVLLKKETDYFTVDTWVMSCRVFGRGLEMLVFNEIVRLAILHKKKIKAEYIPSYKNQLVKDKLKEMGLIEIDGVFELSPTEKNLQTHYIEL